MSKLWICRDIWDDAGLIGDLTRLPHCAGLHFEPWKSGWYRVRQSNKRIRKERRKKDAIVEN
jgi:hypothetical protein